MTGMDSDKHTAVISYSLEDFIKWARNRKIYRNKKNVFQDRFGERYTPIIREHDCYGSVFTEIEFSRDQKTDEMWRLNGIVKKRIR